MVSERECILQTEETCLREEEQKAERKYLHKNLATREQWPFLLTEVQNEL